MEETLDTLCGCKTVENEDGNISWTIDREGCRYAELLSQFYALGAEYDNLKEENRRLRGYVPLSGIIQL